MSSLRNYAIAFLISIVALSGVAYFAMGVVSGLFSPKDTVEIITDRREVKHFDGEIGGDVSDALQSGRSFTMLIVGTDYDPLVYDYAPDTTGHLTVPKRVNATTIYFVRFDKEKRAMQLCLVPSSTLVTVDYVEMDLGTAYSFKGADYVRDQVSGITGLAVDFLFEFSGRQFVQNGPSTAYTVPFSIDIPSYKGVVGGSYVKGQQISGNALYTYLHYDGFKPTQFTDRVEMINGIFLQTMVKFAASRDATEYYGKLAAFNTDMTTGDVSELFEVLTTLPLFVGAEEHQTTVTSVDLYKCGAFLSNGSFKIDRAAAEELFVSYKNAVSE